MNCPFCSLLNGSMDDREVIGTNESAVAWLHESRAHMGHSVVAARRHVENVSELSSGEAARFVELARSVEGAALAESGADRAILIKLGLQVPHLHLHIYPFSRDATREDVMRVIDGERTDHSNREEKAAFAKRLKARLETGAFA